MLVYQRLNDNFPMIFPFPIADGHRLCPESQDGVSDEAEVAG